MAKKSSSKERNLIFKQKKFLEKKAQNALKKNLEISVFNKLKQLNLNIKFFLNIENKDQLIYCLGTIKNCDNFYIALKLTILKRKFEIVLENYPVFYNYKITNKTREKYLETEIKKIEKQRER